MYIFTSLHISSQDLEKYIEIAAILRFPISGINEIEYD